MRITGYSGCQGCQSSEAQPAAQQQRPARQFAAAERTRTSPSERFAARAAQSTRAELSLTTADGDKVVLSFSSGSRSAVSAESDGDYASLRSSQRSRAEVKIQVEGDLSKDELADIQELARLVASAAGDALRGDTGQAAAKTAKAAELDSIQNFAFSLNQRSDYRYRYRSQPAEA